MIQLLAANIPDGLIYGITPVLVGGAFAAAAFLFKSQSNNDRRLTKLEAKDEVIQGLNQEGRIRSLEGRGPR